MVLQDILPICGGMISQCGVGSVVLSIPIRQARLMLTMRGRVLEA
jgi:hypothetical protein